MNTQVKDEGTFTPDNLIAGEFPRIVRKATLTGGNYPAGTILGKITASGKYKSCASAANDGSQNAEAILAYATDATADTEAIIYLTGEFNAGALSAASGTTVASLSDQLRGKGIFIKENQGA